jgi:uncharacterized membrane protein YbhN (UPF0104 family)
MAISLRWRWKYVLYPVAGLVLLNLSYQLLISLYQLPKIQRADPTLLIVAVVNQLVVYLLVVPAMQSFFARCGIRLGGWRTFAMASSGLAFTKIIPAGDYVLWRTWLRHRRGSVNATTQWIIMYYLWMLAGLLLLFFVSQMLTLAFYPHFQSATATLHTRFVRNLRYLPAGMTVLVLLGLMVARWSWLKQVVSKIVFDKLGSRAVSPLGIIRDRHLGRHELTALTMAALGAWFLEAMTLYLCMQAIGLEVPFVIAVFGYASARLFELLPIVPGGIGQIEVGTTVFFAAYGYPFGMVLSATVLYRLITYWPPLMVGLAGYISMRNSSAGGDKDAGRLMLSATLRK